MVIGLLWLAAVVLSTGPAGAITIEPTPEGLIRPEEGEIWRLYRSVLGREPDAAGFGYWVSRRIEGVPLLVVADSFLVGREFESRFGVASDAGFVDLVYRNVLGRRGDPAGSDYWLGQLATGLDRTHLIVLFSESRELRSSTGTEPAPLPVYRATIEAVEPSDLAASWRPGCPVHPRDLRAVVVDHVDYQGRPQRGALVVHRDVADDVAALFGRLYRARFPIAGIRPIDAFGGDDLASMAADNTSAFNCRRVTGGTSWSRHAHGRAIDINPVENPYVGTTVLPPAGSAHVDRTSYHPGMIRQGDIVTSAFAAIGWRWGGGFSGPVDHQHFDR